MFIIASAEGQKKTWKETDRDGQPRAYFHIAFLESPQLNYARKIKVRNDDCVVRNIAHSDIVYDSSCRDLKGNNYRKNDQSTAQRCYFEQFKHNTNYANTHDIIQIPGFLKEYPTDDNGGCKETADNILNTYLPDNRLSQVLFLIKTCDDFVQKDKAAYKAKYIR